MVTGGVARVHKNLHKSRPGNACWSVTPRATGLVEYTHAVTLIGARCHVDPRMAALIAAGSPRKVHAWITGTVDSGVWLLDPVELTYHPHLRPHFYVVGSGERIDRADIVVFTPDGAFIEGFNP
jgi:hypothetical protein